MRNLIEFSGLIPASDKQYWIAPFREIAGMLLSTESLFGRGRDDLAVDHQSRGRIMPLGNTIFSLVETGPPSLLERNGIFEIR